MQIKREKKESLYSTLTADTPQLKSDLSVLLHIKNSVEANELNKVKPELVAFLRQKLNNYSIRFEFILKETEQVEFKDSKSKFEELTKENSSLEKLRKLFNLDIEF